MATQTDGIVLQSTITCPECDHVETEMMPIDACQWFYDCQGYQGHDYDGKAKRSCSLVTNAA